MGYLQLTACTYPNIHIFLNMYACTHARTHVVMVRGGCTTQEAGVEAAGVLAQSVGVMLSVGAASSRDALGTCIQRYVRARERCQQQDSAPTPMTGKSASKTGKSISTAGKSGEGVSLLGALQAACDGVDAAVLGAHNSL